MIYLIKIIIISKIVLVVFRLEKGAQDSADTESQKGS